MPLVPLKPFKVPRRAAASQVSQSAIIPAPVGGLNYRDPISAMDPRAVAYVAGRAPNRWGIMADGSRALVTSAGAKGQEKGSKTAMVKNLFNGLMKGGVSEENAVDYRQHPLYPCISLMLLQV